MSGSTPRATLLSGLGTPRAVLLDALAPGAFGVVAAGGGRAEESESDCLPFVLDGESQAGGEAPLPPPELEAGVVAEEEPDAAVCAYLRLVQEVPPLDGGRKCMTPLQAMERVAAVRARLA